MEFLISSKIYPEAKHPFLLIFPSIAKLYALAL